MTVKPLVLIVDDNVSQLRLTEITLVKFGFRTLTAEHPRDALEILRACTPDLVVLDVHLPDISGLDIAGRLRGVQRLRNVPVLFVTAEKTRAVVEQAEWEGARAVLQKPLNGREFESAVREAVSSLPEPAGHRIHAVVGGGGSVRS